MCISAYVLGFKHAKSLQKDIIPKVIPNPIKAIQEHKQDIEAKQEAEKIAQGWANILAFDGTPQKEEDE